MAHIRTSGLQRSAPHFMADEWDEDYLAPFPAKLDKTKFTNAYGVSIVVGVAGAAANATSIPVAAIKLPSPSVTLISSAGQVIIPAGSIIQFGAASAKKLAVVTADVKDGDVTIACAALPTALVSGDTSVWNLYGKVFVPAGTLVGWTFTVRNASNALLSPGDSTTHDEMFLTAYPVPDLANNNNVELIRPGDAIGIKENYLPDFATLTSGNLAWIRAHYQTVKGYN